MKAVAVFPGKKEIRLIEEKEPKISSPTQAMVKMIEVGICGTDRDICSFQYGTPPLNSDYLIIGHESLGKVVEVGKDVKRVSPGDFVVLMVRRPCSNASCTACRAGRQDFCYTGKFTEHGIKGAHGYMTEFVVDEEIYMNPVPQQLFDVAVLVEPLTIAEKALTQISQVQQRLPWTCSTVPGKNPDYCHCAVVLGAGPVGLLGAMKLVASGFETYVYSKSQNPKLRADLVESIGAKYISAEKETIESLAGRIKNIDLVYEASGASHISFELLELLGTNGVFVFTGVPGRKAPVEVDTDLIMRNLVLKNQIVFGTVNAGQDAYSAAIKDLDNFTKRWPDAVKSLITNRFPIEHYHNVLLKKISGIKNVIRFK